MVAAPALSTLTQRGDHTMSSISMQRTPMAADRRAASVDLPEQVGPTITVRGPPRAAIFSARLPNSWPRHFPVVSAYLDLLKKVSTLAMLISLVSRETTYRELGCCQHALLAPPQDSAARSFLD